MQCPFCEKPVSTERGLAKHLAGNVTYGGHAMLEMEAVEIAQQIFLESFRPNSMDKTTSSLISPLVLPNDEYGAFLAEFFQLLVVNKGLPKYQFERRVDAIIAMFLPGILKQLWGWTVEPVVPEFPLKKAMNNQSTNADSLWFRRGEGSIEAGWIFFELKTDSASCNDLQLQTYIAAMDRGMPELLSDLELISLATSAREKYAALRARLKPFQANAPIELVYLSPQKISCSDPRVKPLAFSDLMNIKLTTHPVVWDLFQQVVIPNLDQ